MHEECESSEISALLGSFGYGTIFRTLFALLLFLRYLMSSILSFYCRTKFCRKKVFVEKNRIGIYCAHQTFVGSGALL